MHSGVAGNVGIGTTIPNSKLEVAGMIHSTSGGFKFPDGSIQVTAASEPYRQPDRAAGNVVLDDNGEARVELPDSLGGPDVDLLYQLTCIGGYAPVYVAEEISSGRFVIAGVEPGSPAAPSWASVAVITSTSNHCSNSAIPRCPALGSD